VSAVRLQACFLEKIKLEINIQANICRIWKG